MHKHKQKLYNKIFLVMYITYWYMIEFYEYLGKQDGERAEGSEPGKRREENAN